MNENEEMRTEAARWKSLDAVGRKTLHFVQREKDPWGNIVCLHVTRRWIERKDFVTIPTADFDILRMGEKYMYVQEIQRALESTWLAVAQAIKNLQWRAEHYGKEIGK